MRQALEKFFCPKIRFMLKKALSDEFFKNMTEIRLRITKPIIIKQQKSEFTINNNDNNNALTKNISDGYIVSKRDLDETFELITNYSPYAFQNEIKNGFITVTGGHRVGLCGETVIQDNKIKTIKNICSINFRVAHQIKNCAQSIIKFITKPVVSGVLDSDKKKSSNILNTIIISPPNCGKTTILRDLIRILSDTECTISVIDERSELGGCYMGVPQNDLGMRVDILDGCPKAMGMITALRSMSPEIIAVDEIGSIDDALAILNISACGVKIICTAHGNDLEQIKNRDAIKILMSKKIFERYIFLDENNIGTIKNIYDYNLQKCC